MEHRYRLSLKVARDGCMFGVTVFGTCLNPFFGIDASALQRLVQQIVFKYNSTSEMCQDFLLLQNNNIASDYQYLYIISYHLHNDAMTPRAAQINY